MTEAAHNAEDVLRDPKLRCLVEELRSHTADEVAAVLKALIQEAAAARIDGKVCDES